MWWHWCGVFLAQPGIRGSRHTVAGWSASVWDMMALGPASSGVWLSLLHWVPSSRWCTMQCRSGYFGESRSHVQ
eukprot:7288372-Karenia_brevis.AAC.1